MGMRLGNRRLLGRPPDLVTGRRDRRGIRVQVSIEAGSAPWRRCRIGHHGCCRTRLAVHAHALSETVAVRTAAVLWRGRRGDAHLKQQETGDHETEVRAHGWHGTPDEKALVGNEFRFESAPLTCRKIQRGTGHSAAYNPWLRRSCVALVLAPAAGPPQGRRALQSPSKCTCVAPWGRRVHFDGTAHE